MGVKEFFQPNKRKVVLVLILVVLSFFYTYVEIPPSIKSGWVFKGEHIYTQKGSVTYIGLPLPYFLRSGFQVAFSDEETYNPKFAFSGCDIKSCKFFLPPTNYLYLYYYNLFFNLIFWYFASCLIIFVYGKIKSKKKRK